MPRMVDYPRAPLDAALDLARTVDALGGTCTEQMAGEAMSRSATGGAFQSLIAATVKYGLVENRKGTISTTQLYKEYKLAYDEGQRTEALTRAFLGVALFRKLHERLVGHPVPHEYLDKLLIREFDVPEDLAGRVGDYFLNGARMAHLLGEAGEVLPVGLTAPAVPPGTGPAGGGADAGDDRDDATHYVVKVTGPGVSSTIAVRGADDLDIVEVILKKVRKALQPGEVAGRE